MIEAVMFERKARVQEGKVVCPFCGCADVMYREDLTVVHRITAIDNDVIMLAEDGETEEEAFNERIVCEECFEASGLPDEFATEFR